MEEYKKGLIHGYVEKALTYNLIPCPKTTNLNEFSAEFEILLFQKYIGFEKWIKKDSKNTRRDKDSYYLGDGSEKFIEYLRDENKENEVKKAEFESDKKRYQKIVSQDDVNEPQQIIPENILDWLQKNGFIEYKNKKLYKWLTTKTDAAVLVTHDNIRGSLGKREVMRKAELLFIDRYGNPLNKLRLPKLTDITEKTDHLQKYLDSLKLKNFPYISNN